MASSCTTGIISESELDLLTNFRERILESKGGVDCLIDDAFLLPFLRSRKFNVDKAVDMLKNFFSAKKAAFSEVSLIPSLHAEVLEEHHVCQLGKLDEAGRRIFWVRPGIWNSSRFSYDQYLASVFLVVNEALRSSPECQELGYTVILDLQGFSLAHVRQVGMTQTRKIMQFVHGAFPVRVKQVHVVRSPRVFNMVWSICKTVLSEKMSKRHLFHGYNMASLHKELDPNILPEALGGSLKFVQAIDQGVKESLLKNDNYYRKLDAAGFE